MNQPESKAAQSTKCPRCAECGREKRNTIHRTSGEQVPGAHEYNPGSMTPYP